MTKQHNVTILGGGSFGTAIANIVADNGHNTCLWLRDAAIADEINKTHHNSTYLPDLKLNGALQATTSLTTATQGADIVFMAVPSQSCRDVAKQASSHLANNTILVSTIKGIEASPFKLMSEVLGEEIPQARLAVLSGPNLAKEIAAKHITATVIASHDETLNETIQSLLHCHYFRVYASSDIYGVELGGALKNVYAIMTGMAAARGVGQNTMSLLITRSLAEMSRFAVYKGADPMTFLGLAGIGDLIATCLSPLSRNYRVGFQLGEGKSLDTIKAQLGQVAEGIHTLKLLKQQSTELKIYMPLVTALYDVIYNRKTIDEVVGDMMFADQQKDVEFVVK